MCSLFYLFVWSIFLSRRLLFCSEGTEGTIGEYPEAFKFFAFMCKKRHFSRKVPSVPGKFYLAFLVVDCFTLRYILFI